MTLFCDNIFCKFCVDGKCNREETKVRLGECGDLVCMDSDDKEEHQEKYEWLERE